MKKIRVTFSALGIASALVISTAIPASAAIASGSRVCTGTRVAQMTVNSTVGSGTWYNYYNSSQQSSFALGGWRVIPAPFQSVNWSASASAFFYGPTTTCA